MEKVQQKRALDRALCYPSKKTPQIKADMRYYNSQPACLVAVLVAHVLQSQQLVAQPTEGCIPFDHATLLQAT